SSTFTRVLMSTNIFEPCMRQARSETPSSSDIFSLPCFSWSKTMYTVISLLMDDGCIGTSDALSSSTVSVASSISSACRAAVSTPCASAACATRAAASAVNANLIMLVHHDAGILIALGNHALQRRVGALHGVERPDAYTIEQPAFQRHMHHMRLADAGQLL